jgi:tRNA (mo5U34)-methyltransferase
VAGGTRAEELRAHADSFAWFHSIDIGDGVVTHGVSEADKTLRPAQLPDFKGKTVLDVGAWDGYYSFFAERNGATRVVALDHYVWGVDLAARDVYWQECRERGVLPDQSRDATEFWRAELPGRRGFDLAKRAIDSKVVPVLADFSTMDVASLGTFDVTLYLGVLYHMKDPLGCLERVRAVTREVAVIETAAFWNPTAPSVPMIRFLTGPELNRDFGNWYLPNLEALQALALAAGFARTEVVQGPPSASARPRRSLRRRAQNPQNYRAVIHAFT